MTKQEIEFCNQKIKDEFEFLDSLDLKPYLKDREDVYKIMDSIKKDHNKEYCNKYNDDYGFFNYTGTDDFLDYIRKRYPNISYNESITYYIFNPNETEIKEEKINNNNQLSSIDRCYELIKEKHANWLGISNQLAIKEILQDREKYLALYETSLAKSLNQSIKDKKKYENELELLNEGWKAELKDYTANDKLRNLLLEKVQDLDKPSKDRWETDEEKHNRLIIEIQLLKKILGMG